VNFSNFDEIFAAPDLASQAPKCWSFIGHRAKLP
jgi:hypothetical protein